MARLLFCNVVDRMVRAIPMPRPVETKPFILEAVMSTTVLGLPISLASIPCQNSRLLQSDTYDGGIPISSGEVKRTGAEMDRDTTSSPLNDFYQAEASEEKYPRPAGILVIEDNRLLRTSLGEGFRNRGFDLWTAADGAEGVELYRQFWPLIDVVLSDVQMPVLDGPGAFKALRAVNPSVRCCFMTGNTCSVTRAKLLKLGAMRVYEKPLPSVANVAQELWELATCPCDSNAFRGNEDMEATDPIGSIEEVHIRDIRVKEDLFQRICAPLLASISELTRRWADRDF